MTEQKKECKVCDYENAVCASRAKWVCPNCKRDFSLEYVIWAKTAHPEWFYQKQGLKFKQHRTAQASLVEQTVNKDNTD